jgi:hypothetical protein
MAASTLTATKRRNTAPTTSTLKMLVEDVDCSGLDAAPEDGQFVQAVGSTASYSADTFEHANTSSVTVGQNAGLCMVWASARRSDRAALSDQKVPVVRNGGRFKTKAFILKDDAKVPSDADNDYAAGALLTVAKSTNAVEGSDKWLFLKPLEDGSTAAWVVGYCIRIVNDSNVAGTGEIEVMLYDAPRLHTGE